MPGGAAAIEAVARKGGYDTVVPFILGRTDATAEQTDARSFEPLEPTIDAFRNYDGEPHPQSAEALMIDRAQLLTLSAQLLTLSAPEMTVLIGGLRVLGANHNDSPHGVFTDRPGTLSNDFFVNLLATSLTATWRASDEEEGVYVATDRRTGERKWTATRVDLIFGANSQLRALAEAYATADAGQVFVDAFVAAWNKVMMADRFDLG